MLPTGLAVGLALRLRYAAIRRRFAPRDLGPPFFRAERAIRRDDDIRAGASGSWLGHILRVVESTRAAHILDRVRATPAGFVRTYGDVSPGAPRMAGAVLHECDDPSVPWHRVVRADGSLAKGRRQRQLLEAEGVPFRGSRVDIRAARIPELL
jgi:methylated-DNA-protein-cysteine methyltransferase related protein